MKAHCFTERRSAVVQYQYPVNMVRHDDELIDPNLADVVREILPGGIDFVPELVQQHRAIDDLAEQAPPTDRACRHEVRAGRRVVVML